MDVDAPGLSVTCTPFYRGKFLMVRRSEVDSTLGGYWGFPGGRVRIGETLTEAAVRECAEETGLVATGRAFFVDSYRLGKRPGVHFCVEVAADDVVLEPTELMDSVWLNALEDMSQFVPRIAGLDNHIFLIERKMTRLGDDAWDMISNLEVVEEGFLNR